MIDKSIPEMIRKKYPPGTRIVLESMNDPESPPAGTQGSVIAVDDIGTIFVNWDNGSTLPVILTGDSCSAVDEIQVVSNEVEASSC